MNKRKELMPDGRRSIVYFTFDEARNEECGVQNGEQSAQCDCTQRSAPSTQHSPEGGAA